MHFEAHALATTEIVDHVTAFLSHNCRCVYFVSHKDRPVTERALIMVPAIRSVRAADPTATH